MAHDSNRCTYGSARQAIPNGGTPVMDINNFLLEHSGSLTYDFYVRYCIQAASPWLTLPKKVAWAEGQGPILTNTMWERPYVADEADWAAIGLNDGTGNSCIPPVDNVEFFHTNRNVSLYHKAVHSPFFCVNDLLFTAKRAEQMTMIQNGLGIQVRDTWIKWNRAGYTRWARKYVAEPGLAFNTEADGETFPPVDTTSRLTNGLLEYFYNILTYEDDGRHALSTQNGRPVYGLITDQFTSRSIIRDEDAIREDFRYAAPDKLLMPLGISHVYNGYVHMIDNTLPRYNFDADLVESPTDNDATDPWVEVPMWILDETDPANPRKEINPAFLTAESQDSFIYVKGAYQLRVPGSIAGVSRANFDPQNYMGEFKWQNVTNLDEDSEAYNPDGTLGRFRGVLASGVEGINPHVMFVIRHRVCGATLGLGACES